MPQPSGRPAASPRRAFRHMVTPGGLRMSVAMSNCGALGWVTDRSGYRYARIDPETAEPGRRCRTRFAAGPARGRTRRLPGFRAGRVPDQSLRAGARLTLHQDRNERDFRGADRLGVARHTGGISVRGTARADKSTCACRWRTATWWSGAGRRGCAITACCRSRRPAMRCWVGSAST